MISQLLVLFLKSNEVVFASQRVKQRIFFFLAIAKNRLEQLSAAPGPGKSFSSLYK